MSSVISSISSQITSNIFSKVDTKNQGYIEKADLTKALNAVSNDDANADTDELFKSIDSDSDGKITKSEMSKSIENLLSQLNNSKTRGGEAPPPPPDGMPPNGPPPGEGDDAGVTKEQATKMAADTSDQKLSSLMSKVAENFEAADTNEDGKVSFQEAKAYEESTKQNEGSQESTSTSENSALKNIAKLVQTYGLGNSSSLSTTA